MDTEIKEPIKIQWSERSETIAELAKALAKTQGQIEKAKKDSLNPHLRNKYADISSIWDAIREPLTANGLCILQEPRSANGGVLLTTTLLHSSGEYIRSSLTMPVTKQDPQGYGSAITYARRYSLQSIVGIAAEDDDGNAASQKQAPQRSQQAAPQPAKQATPAATDTRYVRYTFPNEMEGRQQCIDKLKALKFRWDGSTKQWFGPVEVPELAQFRVINADKPAPAKRAAQDGPAPTPDYDDMPDYEQLMASKQ